MPRIFRQSGADHGDKSTNRISNQQAQTLLPLGQQRRTLCDRSLAKTKFRAGVNQVLSQSIDYPMGEASIFKCNFGKANIELSCRPVTMPGTLGNGSPYNYEASPGGLLKRFVSFPTFDGGVDSCSALSEPKAA